MQVRGSCWPALVVRLFSLRTFKMESVNRFLSVGLNHWSIPTASYKQCSCRRNAIFLLPEQLHLRKKKEKRVKVCVHAWVWVRQRDIHCVPVIQGFRLYKFSTIKLGLISLFVLSPVIGNQCNKLTSSPTFLPVTDRSDPVRFLLLSS